MTTRANMHYFLADGTMLTPEQMVVELNKKIGKGPTLAGAVHHLGKALNEGKTIECPCCKQTAKIYRRSIYAQMAKDLIKIHRFDPKHGWVYAPAVLGSGGGDFAKLRYWGLIEESEEERADGGRAGWWKITPLGADYVSNTAHVQATAVVYNGGLLHLDGKWVKIEDALGKKFNYNDLMAGRRV